MKKLLFFSLMCLVTLAMQAQNYVDLGLPSGTLWKDRNEGGGNNGFYTYDEAVSKFGSRLPTKEQCEELGRSCQWSWTGSGYKVTGPNGNSISLPAAGYRNCNGSVNNVGSNGNYWSSTPKDSDNAWNLNFNSGSVNMNNNNRCNGKSVRLVQVFAKWTHSSPIFSGPTTTRGATSATPTASCASR